MTFSPVNRIMANSTNSIKKLSATSRRRIGSSPSRSVATEEADLTNQRSAITGEAATSAAVIRGASTRPKSENRTQTRLDRNRATTGNPSTLVAIGSRKRHHERITTAE